jgi:hypothetical protein
VSFLLDTNILSAHLRRPAGLAHRFFQHSGGLYTSAVSLARKGVDDTSSLLTVAGVYRDGKVEFAERPSGVAEDAPVLVTFLPANQGSESEPSADAAEDARRAARERFLARLKQGIPFGGPPYPKREELP